MCEELVANLHICEDWITILHNWEKSSSSQIRRKRAYSSHVKIIKMLNTYFRPPKWSKLTIRKFHICQKWRFGTSSSRGLKFAKRQICGSTELWQTQIFQPNWLILCILHQFLKWKTQRPLIRGQGTSIPTVSWLLACWVIFHGFCSLLFIFNSVFFSSFFFFFSEYFFFENPPVCQTVCIQIRPAFCLVWSGPIMF